MMSPKRRTLVSFVFEYLQCIIICFVTDYTSVAWFQISIPYPWRIIRNTVAGVGTGTGVSTPRRSVLGEKQNSSENWKIFPGIRSFGKFSGKDNAKKLKFWEFWDFWGNSFQIFGTVCQILGRTVIYTWHCSNSIC